MRWLDAAWIHSHAFKAEATGRIFSHALKAGRPQISNAYWSRPQVLPPGPTEEDPTPLGRAQTGF